MKDEIKRGAVALAGILSGLLVCGILMRLIGAPSPEPSDEEKIKDVQKKDRNRACGVVVFLRRDYRFCDKWIRIV